MYTKLLYCVENRVNSTIPVRNSYCSYLAREWYGVGHPVDQHAILCRLLAFEWWQRRWTDVNPSDIDDRLLHGIVCGILCGVFWVYFHVRPKIPPMWYFLYQNSISPYVEIPIPSLEFVDFSWCWRGKSTAEWTGIVEFRGQKFHNTIRNTKFCSRTHVFENDKTQQQTMTTPMHLAHVPIRTANLGHLHSKSNAPIGMIWLYALQINRF